MRISLAVTSRAAPGRLEEAIDVARHGAKIMERHGASDTRLLSGALSLESLGLLVLSSEFANAEAFGTYHDSVMSDDETQSLLRRTDSPSSPNALAGITIANEIPTGRPAGTPGRVIDVVIVRPTPNTTLEAAVEIGSKAFALLERVGASRCRLWQQTIAGSQTDALVSTMEYQSMAAFGRAMDRFMDDPVGQEVLAGTQGPGAKVTTQSHDLFTEIPL